MKIIATMENQRVLVEMSGDEFNNLQWISGIEYDCRSGKVGTSVEIGKVKEAITIFGDLKAFSADIKTLLAKFAKLAAFLESHPHKK